MYSDVSGNEVVNITLSQNQLALSRNPQQKAIIFANKALKLGGDQQAVEAVLYSADDLDKYLVDSWTNSVMEMRSTVEGWFSQGNRSVTIRDIGNNRNSLSDLNDNCYIAISGYVWSDLTTANDLYVLLANDYNSNSKACYGVAAIPFANFTNDNKRNLTNIKSLFTLATNDSSTMVQMGIGAIGYELSNYQPSVTNKVNPMTYRRLYNSEPLSDDDYRANKHLQDDFYTNMLMSPPNDGSGARSLVYPGIMTDGNDFTYWYGIDYIRFTLISNITNFLIESANSKINPLYYNQDGIDRLKAKVNQIISNCAAYGIIQINYRIDAISYYEYVTQNPDDYKNEVYGGISIEVSPLKALRKIRFSLQVTDLIAQ